LNHSSGVQREMPVTAIKKLETKNGNSETELLNKSIANPNSADSAFSTETSEVISETSEDYIKSSITKLDNGSYSRTSFKQSSELKTNAETLGTFDLAYFNRQMDLQTPIITQEKNKGKVKVRLGLIQGINFTEDRFVSPSANFKDLYDDVHKSEIGYSAGLSLDYDISKKWTIVGGIHYTQFVTQLTFDFEKINVSKGEGIQQLVVNSQGAVIEEPGEVVIYEISNSSGIWYQFEDILNASVALNYSFYNKNRIRFDGGLGLRTPLFSKHRGSRLVNEGDSFSISSNNNLRPLYSRLNPFGTIRVNYQINRSYTIGLVGTISNQQKYIDHIFQSSILHRNSYDIGLSFRRFL